MLYTPVQAMQGRLGADEAVSQAFCAAAWLAILGGAFHLAWTRGTRRFAGQVAGELPGHDRYGGPQDHGLVVVGSPFVVAH